MKNLWLWTMALALCWPPSTLVGQSVDVPKTNPMKVYMHYMPWFETPQTLGGTNWGYHWKFNNRNPNVIDAEGRRQIASHYYPKIGPYASSDPDVIEYHLLLMKYAGVDGLMIDWYGEQGTNGDVASLLANSNAVIGKLDDFGMEFSVVAEDRFWTTAPGGSTPDIDKAKANFAYLRNNYFNNPQYTRLGAASDPLVSVFGPIRFQTEGQWNQIVAEAGEPIELLTLWYEKNDAGANADGEYAWIYEDANSNNHISHQSNFWQVRAPSLATAGGVAYPGFNDYYQEGGTSTVIPFDIPHNNGQTLASTLAFASQFPANVDFLQLATWNDFGEGTMFEPTVETGFSYLVRLQQFTGVPYSQAELELAYRLYRARKEHAGDAATQALLDRASADLSGLDVPAARAILDEIDPLGDFDDDQDVDGADFLLWQRQIGATGLYPLNRPAADANADGIVDGADLALWRAGAASTAAAHAVPEPASLASWLAAVAILGTRSLASVGSRD
jgi:hypothetical protein